MNKEQYAKFVHENPNATIFHQPWWLDIVTDGQWNFSAFETEKGIEAVLPYWQRKVRGRLHVIEAPPLTPILDPVFDRARHWAGSGKALGEEHKIQEGLIRGLPTTDMTVVAFRPGYLNSLAWKWQGFDAKLDCTYHMRVLPSDEVLAGLDGKLRSSVRGAEKLLAVSEDRSADVLFSLTSKSYSRHNNAPPFSFNMLCKLTETLLAQGRGRILVAKDQENRVHAATLVIWDSHTAYYLIGGSDPAFRHAGANALLIVKQISMLSAEIKTFDLEGSSISSIESFFRGLGGTQVASMRTVRTNAKWNFVNRTKRLLKRMLRT